MPSGDLNLFTQVKNVVARTFDVSVEDIEPESGHETISGWDSIGHLQLMMQVELSFGVRFSTDQIRQPRNVRELCELLNSMGVHD